MGQSVVERIRALKKERNAVILVHNYQPPEVQDIADFLGDSLELSRKAAQTNADVIVFCGVHFMAETAAILSPRKKVLLPEPSSGCPMASMINAEKLRALKKLHPGAAVVAYVNTTAEVKAESDVCCTSANAENVIRSIDAEKIIFVPDKYLGGFTGKKTGKEIVLYEGYCPVHARILPEYVEEARRLHPGAEVLVHPECLTLVAHLADQVLSTTGMCVYVKSSPKKKFIIGTEVGILHRMRKDNPDKEFHPVTGLALCEDMKKTTVRRVLASLEELKHEIRVEESVRKKALSAITRMLEYGRKD